MKEELRKALMAVCAAHGVIDAELVVDDMLDTREQRVLLRCYANIEARLEECQADKERVWPPEPRHA
jgi:hypothetical protein